MTYRTTATFAGILAFGAAHAGLNLIANGSFELNAYSGSTPFQYVTLGAADPSINNWTINSGSVDLIDTYWQADQGHFSLDMSGNSPSEISQTVGGLMSGHAYIVTFDLSGNPDGPPYPKVLEVEADGGQSALYSFPSVTNTHANMQWQAESYTFIAGASTEVISFASSSPPGGGYGPTPFGPALDNVALTPSPVAALPMALGIVPLIRKRRRSR